MQVCAKAEGESCGGPWGTAGKCAPGLKYVDITQKISLLLTFVDHPYIPYSSDVLVTHNLREAFVMVS